MKHPRTTKSPAWWCSDYRTEAWRPFGLAGPFPAPNFPNSAFSARIVGENGILELDAYGTLRLGCEGKWTVVTEQAPIDFKGKGMLDPVRLEAYATQGNEFLNSIRERRPASVTGEDGRAAVQIALAAYESAARNQTVLL